MKRTMMTVCILAAFALVSCGQGSNPPPIPKTTETFPSTLPVNGTKMPAVSHVPSTSTPEPCNPKVQEHCITTGHFLLRRPIIPPGNDSVERTYPFGSTDGGTREVHHGVEITNATGTPVHAAGDGVVLFAGLDDKEAIYSPWKNFYGNVIVIRHANDLHTLYAHLSQIDVTAGEQVKAGKKIGEVGKTGGAIGSHLHFEVRRGQVKDYFSGLNPELWLLPRRGEGVLAISVIDPAGNFREADITIQSGGDSYFINTYEEQFLSMDENAALGELPPGKYRITFFAGGQFFERWVEVQDGRLTQVIFVVE